MASEAHRERQDDELQVLQSIYADDFKDLRLKTAWKVYRPPEVRITLRPQESTSAGGECHVQLDLIISCSPTYPDVVPEFKVDNTKGLSNQQIAQLKLDLEMKGKQLQGEEMLLELCQLVQSFLYTHNKPPPKSFYDEMMSNKRKQEEREAQEQQRKIELLRRKEEKEMQIIEGQIQKRKEALKEETRKRREETRRESESDDAVRPVDLPVSPVKAGSPTDSRLRGYSSSPKTPTDNKDWEKGDRPVRQRRTSTPVCLDDDIHHHCKHHTGGIVVLAFNTKSERTVHRGTCLGHGLNGSTVYVGIDTKTGDLVAIAEWVLKWRHIARKSRAGSGSEEEKEAAVCTKQISSIEQEMFSLLKLKHRNLLHYLAIKHEEETGKITVYLLMEYSGGQNLDIYITRKRLTMDVLCGYTCEVLDALLYLHNKAVVHKNLRASSVFIDTNGRVRLADYSINKRLCDLYNQVQESKPGVKFTDNYSPAPMGRGGKKGDVYQLGMLLLSLSQGSQVEELVPSIPSTLPPVFQDFLSKCLLRDDRLRWSCTQLIDHPFVKEPLPYVIPHHDQSQPARGEEKTNNNEEEEEDLAPFITAWEASGQSRLTNEFDVLKSLGKGGFGDVIKVRNKLDGRRYAIKRIPLNPRSQVFNRKITREVKLLSRLNHENVVRYYNSWIETSDEPASSESSSSTSVTPQTTDSDRKVGLPTNFLKNSLSVMDNVEMFAPAANSVSMDFSISYEMSRSRSHVFQDDDSSDDSDSGEVDDVFGMFMDERSEDSSDNVVFEHNFDDMDPGTSQRDVEKSQKEKSEEQSSVSLSKQYLYIQMEYCEKSTLRNCIDAGLYEDTNRVWRLFREIVEGLVHIHEQGMIHRDLKPVNIFLDSNDHVKIGDFGLATSDIISKGKESSFLMSGADIHDMSSRSGSLGDGNLTGMVGTALYVSPEMMMQDNKITYSQKVDIYSLGIIFFEMCYKPLETGMERVQVLVQLRQKDIRFPEDFNQIEMEDQYHILQWLLNHDPEKRPTSKELLQSEYIPPPLMEEAELNEVLRSTISDPQSKTYHRMIGALFSQEVSLADDHMYDTDLYKGSFSVRTSLTQRIVYDGLERVFQCHGAVRLSAPLLMPRPKMYENIDQYTCLMDHSGRLVGLPFDLRVPFARYITRTNINHVKRYCIEKVFRKKRICGFHPRELIECAFDIITKSDSFSLIPDAELIIVAQDIINQFAPLQQRNYYIRMNHMSLLKAVLMHVGIPEEKHKAMLLSLTELKRDAKSKQKIMSHFNISEQTSAALFGYLDMEGSHNKVCSILRTITKTKGQAGSLAKQGLHELEAVITNVEHLGLKLPVIVSVGWVFSPQLYNGVIFQMAIDVTRKKKTVSEVLAAGGRFDDLMDQFESPVFLSSVTKHSGVGMSVAFERIVSAHLEQADFQPPSAYDILVCTIGRKPMLKERMALVKDLWNAGLKAEILHETLEGQEEIQDFCRAHGISQLVILKDSEGSLLKVRSIEKERVTEKIVPAAVLVEFLLQKLQANEVEQKSSGTTSASKTSLSAQQHPDCAPQPVSSGSNISMNFTFILPDGVKLQSNMRRKYEAQIVSRVNMCFPWLSMKCIEVVALELTIMALRIITAFLDVDASESVFESSISTVVEKLPRHRKYLSKITDHIHHLVFENKCNCIVLYGTKDDSIKLLTSS